MVADEVVVAICCGIIGVISFGLVFYFVYTICIENRSSDRRKKTFMEKVAINWKDLKNFIWNIEKGEVLGRTGLGWLFFILYLLLVYTIVFGLFALLLWLRLRYLPDTDKGPYRTNYLTFDGPGINTIPYGRRKETEYKYKLSQPKTMKYFIDRRTEYLLDYITIDGKDYSSLFEECASGSLQPSQICGVVNDDDRTFQYFEAVNLINSTTVKAYNMFNLGDCYQDDGFQKAEPCFLMTINKVWGWMPDKLRANSVKDEKWTSEVDQFDENFVPLVCQGLRQEDRDHISDIAIYPRRGFSRGYFPWEGQKNYRSPLVAVQVKIAPSGYGRDLRVECLILADNIFHRSEQPNAGRTELRIRIDE